MGVELGGTQIALSRYGEYCERVVPAPTKKIPRAILRRIFDSSGREMLVATLVKRLSWIDRIKLFFGHSDFRLNTIQRVATEAVCTSTRVLESSDYAHIEFALKVLNSSIQSYNQKILTKIFRRSTLETIDSSTVQVWKKAHPKQKQAPRVPPQVQEQPEEPYVSFLTRIRGIQNPGCLCYCNSSIVALFASPAFRQLLTQEDNLLAKQLRAVFEDLQKTGASLSHTEAGSLHDLNESLQHLFPPLKRYFEQQDASELMGPLLEEAFKHHPFLFTVVPITERERMDHESALRACKEAVGVPPVQAMYIPSLDRTVQIGDPAYKTSMVQIKIPEDYPAFDIGSFFTGYRQLEHIEVDAIIGNAQNVSWLTPEKRQALQAAGDSKGRLSPILISTKSRLESVPPPVMPIYIPRFSESGEKNFSPVDAPFLLTVPVGESGSEVYALRSVMIHDGERKQGGHYYAYIPDPSELDSDEHPLRWIRASDSEPKEVLSWDQVRDDIAIQGVMFIYDKLSS